MSENPEVSPPSTARQHPHTVSARVPDEVRDDLLDLRQFYPGPDGAPASLSSVLRGILTDGLALLDPTMHERLRHLAVRKKIDPAEALKRALEAGLNELESRQT